MIAHEITQGHKDWFALRIGRVTASELGNLLTPEWKPRSGETPKTYLYTKVAEAHRGEPLIHLGSWTTEQGQVRQDEAVPWLAFEKNWDIREGGFIETDNHLAGCSPDGLVAGEDLGVEVKCPEPTNMVRWLIDGVVPKDYICQVHGSLYVTGYDRWIFLAYHRDFPKLIIEVKRDEEIIAKIDAAVQKFHSDFDKAKERIERYEE